jgi:hypothetical protein
MVKRWLSDILPKVDTLMHLAMQDISAMGDRLIRTSTFNVVFYLVKVGS